MHIKENNLIYILANNYSYMLVYVLAVNTNGLLHPCSHWGTTNDSSQLPPSL